MRLRIGVVLCLFAVILAAGCRKPLSPTVDTNLPPETWITAAPMDSITIRDSHGKAGDPDDSRRRIPVRFHVYWAASDPDGAVVGYYWAVTETTATPDPGSDRPPPLPGPKPSEYHYTTRTDMMFTFNVSPDAPDRQHAFFIYAVDNQGKADPTPARFLFTAVDHYPPIPIFLLTGPEVPPKFRLGYARAVGSIIPYPPTGYPPVTQPETTYFRDVSSASFPPRDTAAANSRLDFEWDAQLGIAGNDVKRFYYKLDEPDFVPCDSCHAVSYNSGLPGSTPIAIGNKVFRLRITDIAGGAADSTRRVYLNRAPESWFSGPDPNDGNLFAQTRDPVDSKDAGNHVGDLYYAPLASLNLPGTLLSPDSFTVLPVDRPMRKTFFEIWDKRVYAHFEGDTVHLNSWVVFYSGGYDKDSKYRVKVDPNDQVFQGPNKIDTTGKAVLNPRPEWGSPIGFRSQLTIKKDPFGTTVPFTASGLAPTFNSLSVTRLPAIGAYWPMQISGRAFVVTRAEDGDGGIDLTVPSPSDLVAHHEAHTATEAEEWYFQRKVLSFYVNRSPYFQVCDPTFVPASPCQPNYTGSTVFHGKSWVVNLLANDSDPFDPNQRSNNPAIGGPVYTVSGGPFLRYRIRILGKDLAQNDRVFEYHQDSNPKSDPTYYNKFNVTLNLGTNVFLLNDRGDKVFAGDSLATGPVRVQVQLCDCKDCEINEGEGACTVQEFPAVYSLTLAGEPAASGVIRGRDR